MSPKRVTKACMRRALPDVNSQLVARTTIGEEVGRWNVTFSGRRQSERVEWRRDDEKDVEESRGTNRT